MDDERLWDEFSKSSLPATAWTHQAHVRTAFLFVSRFAIDEAHLRMRAGIIRLNERHGLVESITRGYFETLSRAWLTLVADARRRSGAGTSQALFEACPELMDRTLPLRHYSRELLASPRARAIFIPPDITPLPAID